MRKYENEMSKNGEKLIISKWFKILKKIFFNF